MSPDVISDESPSRENVWQMFDRISGRYDLLNHLLSAGQDIRWRRRIRKFLPPGNNLRLLDIATGTGDQLFSLLKDTRIEQGTGIDLAEEMLKIGQRKAIKKELTDRVEFSRGDACDLQFPANKFDVATISFGIRNVTDLNKALAEMYRVLKHNGRLIILEFSLPESRFLQQLYLFYFRKVLPAIGTIISGDSYAYRYLNETVETFPFGSDFCNLLVQAGFGNVRFVQLTFGVATIYIADKSG